MTPEELNRTIEFIIQSQARLAAAQEQDRQDRQQEREELLAADEKERQNRIQFEEWGKRLFKQMADLFEHQSQRMDYLDKLYAEWLRRQPGSIS